MFLEIRGIKKSFGSGRQQGGCAEGNWSCIEKGEFCVLLDLPVQESPHF